MARSRHNRFPILPDRGVAQAIRPLVEAILRHWKLVETNGYHAQLDILEALYVQHALYMCVRETPDWEADELLLRRALFEPSLTERQLTLGWVQCIRLHMTRTLISRYAITSRVDASFELLERVRTEATGSGGGHWWDPYHIHCTAYIAAHNSNLYGIQRCLSFVLESKRLLESELTKKNAVINWIKPFGQSYREGELSRYNQDISTWLSMLRRRAFEVASRGS